MKLINSLCFLIIGFIMALLPQVAPGLCPTDVFGNSVRASWLHLMGLTQIVIGASFLVRKAGAEMALWLERWPELINPVAAPELDPVPQGGLLAFPRSQPVQQLGEVIPVDFKPAWSEQRAA